MTRLFLSLYLFIAISLVLLSAGLERIILDDTHNEQDKWQSIWLSLIESHKSQPEEFTAILSAAKIEYRILKKSDIATNKTLSNHLHNDRIFSFYDDKHWRVFVLFTDDSLIDVSFPIDSQRSTQWWLYSSVFFILLAGVIAVWMYPLWRDLQSLIRSTKTIGEDGSFDVPQLSARSYLRDVAEAMRDLSFRVSTLIRNQQELAGAITHEFKTPLARMKFALENINGLNAVKRSELRLDIDEIDRLIQEMLDYTRLNVQTPELLMESIPVFDLCQQRVLKFSESTTKSISISGSAPVLNADGHLVARALDNLLSNAIRHAKNTIHVSVEEANDSISIHVEDDGEGLDEDYYEKIFEPFFRPQTSRDRQAGNTGLGLAIVKRIQGWHNGDCLIARSSLGGAKFSLLFPI